MNVKWVCFIYDMCCLTGGLECEVEEKGRVFSAGQCQLVCLARALITRACIICIDEATSSVDQQTDSEIQLTLRSKFPTSTVITIAHRCGRTDSLLLSQITLSWTFLIYNSKYSVVCVCVLLYLHSPPISCIVSHWHSFQQ